MPRATPWEPPSTRTHVTRNRALRRCRDTRVLPPRPDRYGQAMARMLKSALPYSPFIESGEGDGHLFVDATGSSRLLGPPVDVAWRLGRRIRQDLGLAPIWSVATSKLIAKTATRLVKPLGEYIVEPGDEAGDGGRGLERLDQRREPGADHQGN